MPDHSSRLGAALATELRRVGVTDVLTDTISRAAYSSDASLYRVPPLAVVRPRGHDDVAAVVERCSQHGIAVTSRGAGTSVAGNAVGPGVVLDFSRHMNQVLDIDAAARTARVEPGVVQASLQRVAAPHALRFGPDPSTHTRCTIGGMIGNNACGSRTLGYGRTSDNVLGLRVITGTGSELDLRAEGGTAPTQPQLTELHRLVHAHLATIRTEFATFGRQVSGYALEHLLPENRFNAARFLVGSEGTLAVTTQATVRLVTDPRHRVLVVLGYPDIATAGDHAPATLAHQPTACEAIDARIVDVVRARRGPAAVPDLPAGAAWLFAEVSGDDREEVLQRAHALAGSCDALDSRVVPDPAQAAALWRIREDGAGLAGRSPAGLAAHAGWEDSAVPPAAMGAYLRDFEKLMDQHGVTGLPYGHFADGCLHIRLDLPLHRADGPRILRAFLGDAAALVARYGGSLSGEHGDGRARSELLPAMYSPAALDLFAKVKTVFDPGNLLNPGVLVDPRPVDADLRAPQARPLTRSLALHFADDNGDFSQAVHRCTGVGRCRADNTAGGGVMCPSYQATQEEKDSTRGRARLLQEMVNGTLVRTRWRSPEVHEALDLCLSCKGCLSDCPTGIDMASYKSEVLHQSFRHRLRPAAHYSLGWLPRWARLAAHAPRLVNRMTRLPGIAPAALAAAGVDKRRTVPPFAEQTFRQWFEASQAERAQSGTPVVLFTDTFTNYFAPQVGIAAVRVLEDAGYQPRLTSRQECCGLTWISTGQLDSARRKMSRTVKALAPAVQEGIPVIGLEPSCTAALRHDAAQLLGAAESEPVSGAMRTLAELLNDTPDWSPPDLGGQPVTAQPHCHHHAVMGWEADEELLSSAGAKLTRLGGCCGLAGNFGVEQGHYEVSVKVAESQLLPALRAAENDAVIMADGYSCRTQITDLSERSSLHLAEVLAQRLPNSGTQVRGSGL